jgi:hypothetical protein
MRLATENLVMELNRLSSFAEMELAFQNETRPESLSFYAYRVILL